MSQPAVHAPDRIARAVKHVASTPLGFFDLAEVVDHTYAIAVAARAKDIADWLGRCASRTRETDVGAFTAEVAALLRQEADRALFEYGLD